MPIKASNYVGLDVGKAGVLFLSEIPDVPRLEEPTAVSVSKFELSTRKTEPFLSGLRNFVVSANGEKVLYRPDNDGWFITGTSVVPKPGDGALKMDALEVYVDPRAEWNQMYHEVWRIQRDFLYDPELLGREEVDEKALAGLRGVVKISHTTVNGTSLLNFDGFAPASQWEELSFAASPKKASPEVA